MFCADVGDKTPIGDVVEGEECGRRADGKQLFRGEEGKAVRVGFELMSENVTQLFS